MGAGEGDTELDRLQAPNKKSPRIINIDKSHRNRRTKAKSWITKKIYILTWLPSYTTSFAISDLIAGITLGLTVIPESIAIALLAGLPTHYGLYSSFIGPLIYVVFGTINKVLIGPTSLLALVTLQFTMGKPHELVFVLTFLAGVVELSLGVLQLGFIFDFISMPVIKAFTSATAVLVAESQIKSILGIKYLVPGFINSIQTLFQKLDEARLGDAVVGLSSIAFLVVFLLIGRIPFKETTKIGKFFKVLFGYLSISRNALIVLLTAIITFIWLSLSTEEVPYRLSQNIIPGLPNMSWPAFEIQSGNHTYTFVEICSELGIAIVVIPIVSVLTNISIAKALTPKGQVEAGQELFTLGLCNIIGSMVMSMPTCGAFSRAGISAASGIKTSIAGIYSSCIVILALSLLTPYFHYIPQATLAAILICAILPLIDLKLPIKLFRDSKRDLVIWISCFIVCIAFGVEVGLLFGIMANAAHLLYLWARPNITVKIEQIDDMQYIRVSPENGLFFPGVDFLRQKIMKACVAAQFSVPVLIDCRKVIGLDYTAAQGLTKLARDLDDGGRLQLLILEKLDVSLQPMIDVVMNIQFCDTEDRLRELLTQQSLRNGSISLKDHIRASIDLGYKIDP